jgi:predicted permease
VTLLHDIRHALRLLRRTPGLTAVAILSLAITIGITGVVFTALKTVLIDPLPYTRASELIFLHSEGLVAHWVNWSDMEDVRRRNRTLESLGTYHYALFNLKADTVNPPQALYGLYVSAALFPTLGVAPTIGRNILPEETQPGHDREVILSYGLWARRFASDRNITGRTLVANGRDYTIIGVMPPGFDFPLRLATTVRTPSRYMEFWAPLALDPAKVDRRSTGFGAVARLKPGIGKVQADQDLASIARALAREYPHSNKDRPIRAISLEAQTFGPVRPALLILMAAAAMFMLIGCSNVANLLLARSLARQGEIAVRLALGAARSRIVRQLITESCVLAIAGGVCGYLLTVAAWRLLPAIVPTTIPRLDGSHVDWTIFAFTLAVSVANGFVFGIAPALRTVGHDPANALRESGVRGSVGRGRSRIGSAFVIAEIAITVVLVIAGSLLTASFVRLLGTGLGFQTDHLLASIVIPQGEAYKNPEDWGLFNRRVVDAARALPGVESAGMVDALPFSGENNGASIRTGDPGEAPRGPADVAELDHVTSDYLQTMGVRLLQGRWFDKHDESNSSDVALVDEIAVRRFWPGRNPIGKRICINCDEGRPQVWKQVIGVVNNIKHTSLEATAGPEVYLTVSALAQGQFLVLRTRGRAMDLAPAVRQMVASLDPNVPVYLSAAMSTFVGDSVSDRLFIMALLAVTGILALLLAAAGVYAVVSYATSRRTQEIGVRMALGATRGDVRGLVLREGMKMAGWGVVIGLAAALVVNRVLHGVLAGLGNSDGTTIAVAVILVTATAAVACLVPARRATRIDPMAALRHE